MPDWGIVAIIAIVVIFGATKLPQIARNMGKAQNEFKRGLKEGAGEEEAAPPAASAPAAPPPAAPPAAAPPAPPAPPAQQPGPVENPPA
jgi:sec-independent protein translocase protein TatA